MKVTDVTDFVGITHTRKDMPVEAEKSSFDRENLGPKKTLMSWVAVPNIGANNLDPRYKRAVYAAGFITILILVMMQEFWLIFVIASLVFIVQVMGKMKNKEEKYEITTHGLHIETDFYYWDELIDFFFTKKFGNDLLAVDMKKGLTTRLFLGYQAEDRNKLIEILNKHIRYLEKEPDNFVDATYSKVLDKFDFKQK